jgi:hypothetical protein
MRYVQNFSLPFVTRIKKVAIVGFEMSGTRRPLSLPGVEVRSVRAFMSEVAGYARSKSSTTSAIPEAFPLARMSQYLAHFRMLDSDSNTSSAARTGK